MTRTQKGTQTSALGRWWDNLAVRERRMVMVLGISVTVVALLAVAWVIRSGLDKRRKHNQLLSEAIKTIDKGREAVAASKRRDEELMAIIGPTAPVLSTYLEAAAAKAGVSIPEQTDRTPQPRGKFVEKSVDMKLRGVTLEQLGNFLKNVEESQVVVVQRLQVKTYFNQHERLDVDLTVATFERAKEAPKKPSKPGDKGGKGTDGAGDDKETTG